MFEKSLYDLIRGLRNHKGNERAYIQDSIRECRREIKGQDMDLKAIALLKLTYLEMFGHDMSWASFNVLEVMSSQKYPQKRVGYLAAVQSFRPDTEVLMLAENQLKKDLQSAMPTTISLPLITIPHVISAPMANSLLSELLPRLSHSNAIIRKKTIVTLYRLALVFPETLRPAWPKLKERLLDETEDPSVTASVVNVVCELGWRRPHDFLNLAPRLFDLLVEGSNNWMAIKIIKLFAILTPLEPRLVKKLLPPLTTLIKTTSAKSLLYECINGIISGGILTSASRSTEEDDIARLCVGKLRSMLAVEGDPNLKYVALLAFNRIVEYHPYLVSLHEDVILECIDEPDISIRLRALDLAAGMVNAQNLTSIVDRLVRQLQESPLNPPTDETVNDRSLSNGIEPAADSDDEDPAQAIRPKKEEPRQDAPLPVEYRISIIRKILEMCCQKTYSHISDFEWYINCLLLLIRHVPTSMTTARDLTSTPSHSPDDTVSGIRDIALEIGCELRNVAVRVKSSRVQAVRAAEDLLSISKSTIFYPLTNSGAQSVLGSIAWIVGEYASYVADLQNCLDSLLHCTSLDLSPTILNIYIQSSAKLCASIISNQEQSWSPERKTMMSLLITRMIDFLEYFTTHPDLEIQDTAVQYLELMRLAKEAIASHSSDAYQPPLLLTSAIPSLFSGAELNPVARDAQRKVPVPEELDLDKPINQHLDTLLNVMDAIGESQDDPDFNDYYYRRAQRRPDVAQPAVNRLQDVEEPLSYQSGGTDYLDPDTVAKRRAERQYQAKNDPFYISAPSRSGTATPMHEILRSQNGEELDIDSIPIMELDLGNDDPNQRLFDKHNTSSQYKQNPRRNFEVLGDENLDQPGIDGQGPDHTMTANGTSTKSVAGKSVLQVDSSGLQSLSLSGSSISRGRSQLDVERQEAEEAEMAQAMKEVERLRLEMQRAQERIQSKQETTVIRKKKKKKKTATNDEDTQVQSTQDADPMVGGATEPTSRAADPVQEPKKKKKAKQTEKGTADVGEEEPVKPKKKKKRREIHLDEPNVM